MQYQDSISHSFSVALSPYCRQLKLVFLFFFLSFLFFFCTLVYLSLDILCQVTNLSLIRIGLTFFISEHLSCKQNIAFRGSKTSTSYLTFHRHHCAGTHFHTSFLPALGVQHYFRRWWFRYNQRSVFSIHSSFMALIYLSKQTEWECVFGYNTWYQLQIFIVCFFVLVISSQGCFFFSLSLAFSFFGFNVSLFLCFSGGGTDHER